MESSVGSNDEPSSSYDDKARRASTRAGRALRQQLFLLERSGGTFHVLGSTCNVYRITLSSPRPRCSCPDPFVPCKHIFFVILRVLRLRLPRTFVLRPSLFSRILASPTDPRSLAAPLLRRRFRRASSAAREDPSPAACPICLEELCGRAAVSCCVCRNRLHRDCWERWRRTSRRRPKCVICRASWRACREPQRYLNLAEIAGEGEGEALG